MCVEISASITEKIKALPASPGVYLMYDGAGQVIYVGKAVVLKNRVRQYFNNSPKPAKVQAMADNVRDIGFILTLSEKDAFSLEANLVRKYMPRYNILLKDDKHSPYIKIDMKQDFPAIEITRKIKNDGAKYFGPYFFGIRVNDIADIIRAAYKIRACPKRLTKKRACLNYHIGMCSAPCEGLVSREEYAAQLKKAVAFLSGRDDEAERLLTKKMEDAAENEHFERAIEHRDRLKMLARLKERSISTGEVKVSSDSIAYVWESGEWGVGSEELGVRSGELGVRSGEWGVGSGVKERGLERWNMAGGKEMDGNRSEAVENNNLNLPITPHFPLPTPHSREDGAITVNLFRGNKMMGVKNYPASAATLSPADAISSFITQYYAQNEIPEEILLNIKFEYEGLSEYLSALAGRKTRVLYPQKGIKKRLVEMAEKNAAEFLAASGDKVKRRHDMGVGAAERLKDILVIRSARRIECYDISNISGTDSVASGVVFIDGEPSKRDYRRYRIKTVEGADDFASMREVILRRLKGDLPPPDLIVIDGGKGQLSAALSAAEEVFGKRAENGYADVQKGGWVELSFISLAKKEELIYLPDREEPIALSKNDYALRLLQRIRDEAHRFALNYHTKLRGRKIGSELLNIEGVGEKKRAKLLGKLSFAEIKILSAKEIVERSGIDRAAAQRIEKYFKRIENRD